MEHLSPDDQSRNRPVDQIALEAKEKEEVLEAFLLQEMPFVRASAGKKLGRHVEEGSEEELVALEAFVEAVHSYTPEKGRFLPFSRLVMDRRIIDWMRREEKNQRFIPMDPEDITRQMDSPEYGEGILLAGGVNGISDAAEEIHQLSIALSPYGISFRDLPDQSPKSEKTKESCQKVISAIRGSEILLSEMREKKALPLKILEKNTGIPRKIMERHRKYIIAVVEILSGEYPCLRPYVRSMIKED